MKFPTWMTFAPPKTSAPTSRQDNIDPVRVVQRAVADPAGIGFGAVGAALQDIMEQALWRNAFDSNGTLFESFGKFAVAAAPHGLGVSNVPGARLVRHAMLEKRLFAAWTEVLELIARKPGRQPNGANGEGWERFYTISRARTCRDRLLLLLKSRSPEHFTKVCADGYSPYRAAVEAGLVEVAHKGRMRYGVCDIEAAKRLSHSAQKKVLCELFRELPIEAQCALLSREIEPRLGPTLANKWRISRSTTSTPVDD